MRVCVCVYKYIYVYVQWGNECTIEKKILKLTWNRVQLEKKEDRRAKKKVYYYDFYKWHIPK